MMGLDNVKYFQDKFFIRLDGFDLEKLDTFTDDYSFSQQQAIYIHEYYHYLTNLTTFIGARQFNCKFQDKIRIVSILLKRKGINAFPLIHNNDLDCKYEVNYWKSLDELLKLDDIDYDFAEKVEQSPSKKFNIIRYYEQNWPLSVIYDGKNINGAHKYYRIEVKNVPFASAFNLSDGMIDEFLSASIDEFMFQNDLADNCDVLRKQSFYPYRTFDVMLSFFKIKDLSAKDKIMLAYYALHTINPVDALIKILEKMRKDHGETFLSDCEGYLLNCLNDNDINAFASIVKYEYDYIKECLDQGRKNLADSMTLIYKKQCRAIELMKKDYFYFIRPFLVDDVLNKNGRVKMLDLFRSIKKEMEEPIIVQDRKMIAADKDTYKNHLAMQIAIYEIMDSLWINRIATRLQNRIKNYEYPVSCPDNDRLENLIDAMPLTQTWHVALNELGLYGEYIKEKNTLKV